MNLSSKSAQSVKRIRSPGVCCGQHKGHPPPSTLFWGHRAPKRSRTDGAQHCPWASAPTDTNFMVRKPCDGQNENTSSSCLSRLGSTAAASEADLHVGALSGFNRCQEARGAGQRAELRCSHNGGLSQSHRELQS